MRRHLHRNPELSNQEFETTQFLADATRGLGLDACLAGDQRGLTVNFDSRDGSPFRSRIAMRGDIDALPICDHKSVEYKSERTGVMHACGHDVHATVVFGAMQLLTAMDAAGDLPWPIATRAIFQPAEEVAAGAQHMIAAGALDDVEAILALHVDPTREVGKIGLRAGILTAACDMVHVDFHGRGGHGARPHLCRDPIDACTDWVQTAYRRLSRTINPHEIVVFSIGQLNAGHSINVVPESAWLAGSLRSLDSSQRDLALATLQSVCDSVTAQTGVDSKMRLGVSAPAVINDEHLIELLSDSATQVVGPTSPDPINETSMGSEDFSYYLKKIPGAMFRLGVAGNGTGSQPLHTPEFDIDERAIEIGVKLFAASVINYFDPERPDNNVSFT